jgi:hypothetical protein
MLFLLIPIAWLAVVTIFVAACRVAARADAMEASTEPNAPAGAPPAPVMAFRGLKVWEHADPIRLRRVAASLSARPLGPRRLVSARRAGAAGAGASRLRGAHEVAAPTATRS